MTYQEIRQEIAVIKEMIERLILPHFDKNEPFRINNNEIEMHVKKWWYISEKYRFIKHNGVTLDKIFNIVESLDEIRIVEGKEKAKEYYEKFGIELQGAFDYWISRYDDWIAVYKERLSRNALPYRNSTDRTGSYVLYTTVPYDLMNDYVNKTKKDLSEFYKKYLDTENTQQIIVNSLTPSLSINKVPKNEINPEFTTSTQVLAMHYIFQELQEKMNVKSIDMTEKINFIAFITRKDEGVIYKLLTKLIQPKYDIHRKNDLQYIKLLFGGLKLKEIETKIKNELEKPFDLSESESPSIENDIILNNEYSTARQVLAMQQIFNYLKIRYANYTHIKKMLYFLTMKSQANIKEWVGKLYADETTEYKEENLEYIRHYFEDLGLKEIVKMIDNQFYIKKH